MKSKVLANQKIIRRYQHRSWYLSLVIVFMGAAIGLRLTEPKIISPVPDTMTVYAKDSKTQLQEIVDYIVNKWEPYGDRAVTSALACFISESHLNTLAYHWNSNSTADVGVAQINDIWGMTVQERQDYKKNIDKAFSIWVKTHSFQDWYGAYCN